MNDYSWVAGQDLPSVSSTVQASVQSSKLAGFVMQGMCVCTHDFCLIMCSWVLIAGLVTSCCTHCRLSQSCHTVLSTINTSTHGHMCTRYGSHARTPAQKLGHTRNLKFQTSCTCAQAPSCMQGLPLHHTLPSLSAQHHHPCRASSCLQTSRSHRLTNSAISDMTHKPLDWQGAKVHSTMPKYTMACAHGSFAAWPATSS